METWQKHHIKMNLADLIPNIKCNVFFLSCLTQVDILADVDVELLNAKGNLAGDQEKSKCLLDILVSRKGAYKHLASALHNSKQTGAFDILLKGIQKHILSRDVLFQGVRLPLEDLCKPIEREYLQKMIPDNLDATNYEQFLNEEPMTLADNIIPEQLPYYIPRTLSINTQLDPKIFKELENDIFCVEGMELFQLSNLSNGKVNNSSDRSRNQIYEVTARFILLEHKEHFHDIAKRTDKIVHWIKCVSNTNQYFYVKCSTGNGIKSVQKFLILKSPEKLSEDDFLERFLHAPRNAPVLLYDSPGMGKSVLLSRLARRTKENQLNCSVIFLQISDLVSKVNQNQQEPISVAVKLALVESITTNSFGQIIMKNLLDSSDHQIELFLDAFDEIPENDLGAANNILTCITNIFENIRLFITSRRHKRDELEEKLGVLGYNILPFDDSNKISFFLQYWQSEQGVEITDAVKVFAKDSLKTFTAKISSEEGDIAGIPLQCRMLAEIHAEDAKRGGLIPTASHIQLNSVFQVYKKFIDAKFAVFKTNKEKEFIYDFHVRESLMTLFPYTYNGFHHDHPVPDFELIYKRGILEPNKADSRLSTFLHRTLAEFFVAEFLANSLTSKFPNRLLDQSEIISLFFTDTLTFVVDAGLVTTFFEYPVVCRFLNFFLSTTYIPGQDLGTVKNVFRESRYYKADKLIKLMEGMLRINAVNLYWYLLDLYLDLHESSDKTIGLLTFKQNLQYADKETKRLKLCNDLRNSRAHKLVATSAECSSLNLVKLSCEFLERVAGKKVHEFQYGRRDSPMYCALERGHYQIFEYLLDFDREGFYKQPLLHWCLKNSCGRNVEDKVQIVKRILHDRPDLVSKPSPPDFNIAPIQTGGAHFTLLKILIEAGADFTQSNLFSQNITHSTAQYFSAEEYHQLVQLIISHSEEKLFKQRDIWGNTPVHCALTRIDLKSETLELLENTCNVTFNDNSTEWGSELAVAIESGRSERVIKDIIGLGGDMKKLHKPKKRDCLIV